MLYKDWAASKSSQARSKVLALPIPSGMRCYLPASGMPPSCSALALSYSLSKGVRGMSREGLQRRQGCSFTPPLARTLSASGKSGTCQPGLVRREWNRICFPCSLLGSISVGTRRNSWSTACAASVAGITMGLTDSREAELQHASERRWGLVTSHHFQKPF